VNLALATSALSTPRRKNPVSFTALIDVVFILLMFFMLTSTFSKEHSIALKKSQAMAAPIQTEAPQLLLAYENGSFEFFNTALTKLEILSELTALADVDKTVTILPAAEMQVQNIVVLLEALKATGFKKVNLGEPLPKDAQHYE
jgi:biopolymer transport protein ExbD